MYGWNCMWLVVCTVLNKGRRVHPQVFGTDIRMQVAAARLPLFFAKCLKTSRLRSWVPSDGED